MSYSFSELFNYFGGSLGIIISMIILLKMRGKPEVRISLSLLMIVSSLIVILGAIMYSGKAGLLPFLIRIDSPLHYLFPPLCFFYVYASFKPGFRFHWLHLLHLLPFLINVAEFMPFYTSGSETKLEYYRLFLLRGSVVIPTHYYLKTISLTVYFSLGIYVFLKYRTKDTEKEGTPYYFITWFWIFFIGQATLMLVMIIDSLGRLRLFGDPYSFMMMMVTLFIISSTIALLFFPQILYGIEYDPGQKKYIRSKLTDEDKDNILEQLEDYLKNERPFLSPGLSLSDISKRLKINSNRISQVINERKGLNFNDYINLFRVEEAKSLLSSEEYNKLTIDALAAMAGFNSKSPFYAAFKKHTGMTPKEFASHWRSGLT
jgi:AraC-like DNA-binding protein